MHRDSVSDDGGKLALIWNRLRPTNPTRAEFEEIYSDYMDVETRSGDGSPGEVVDMIAASGFTVTQRKYPHDLRYSAQQWVDIAFTFQSAAGPRRQSGRTAGAADRANRPGRCIGGWRRGRDFRHA